MDPRCAINPCLSCVCLRGTKACGVQHELLPGALPLPLSSFIVHGGAVGEVTWTKEDDLIRYKRWNRSELDIWQARTWLRRCAKQGIITARRNPEHGYWEYGPQWRAKNFDSLIDAAHAASLLGGT